MHNFFRRRNKSGSKTPKGHRSTGELPPPTLSEKPNGDPRPEQREIDKRFEEFLETLMETPKGKEQLRMLPLDKKWMMIQQFQPKDISTADRIEEWLSKLSQPIEFTKVNSLKIELDTQTLSSLELFVERGGLNKLLNVLVFLDQSTDATAQEIKLEVLQCIRICVNFESGLARFLKDPSSLRHIMFGANSSDIDSRRTVIEVLACVTIVGQNYRRVLEAMESYRLVKQNPNRFSFLIDFANDASAIRDILLVITFINTLLRMTLSLGQRQELRADFHDLGLNRLIANWEEMAKKSLERLSSTVTETEKQLRIESVWDPELYNKILVQCKYFVAARARDVETEHELAEADVDPENPEQVCLTLFEQMDLDPSADTFNRLMCNLLLVKQLAPPEAAGGCWSAIETFTDAVCAVVTSFREEGEVMPDKLAGFTSLYDRNFPTHSFRYFQVPSFEEKESGPVLFHELGNNKPVFVRPDYFKELHSLKTKELPSLRAQVSRLREDNEILIERLKRSRPTDGAQPADSGTAAAPTPEPNAGALAPPNLQPPTPDGSSLQPPPVTGSSLQPPPLDGTGLQPPPVPEGSLQPPSMGGSSLQPPSMGGSSLQPPSVGGSSLQPPSIGGSSLQPPSMGGSSLQPPSMGGSSLQPPPVGGSSLAPPSMGGSTLAPPSLGSLEPAKQAVPPVPKKKNEKPRVPMRNFNWVKVSDFSVKGTLWENFDKADLPVDNSFFEKLFASTAPAAPLGASSPSTKRPSSPAKTTPKKVTLLDQTRCKAVSIALSRVKASFPDIRTAVLRLDSDILSTDKLEIIVKQATPEPDETTKVLEYVDEHPDDRERLGFTETYFLTIADIKSFRQRVSNWYFALNLSSAVDVIRSDYDKLILSMKTLRCSKKFHKFLRIVLSVGNIMNGGSRRGGAWGFKLSSLNKLSACRDTSGSRSLLHAVILYCQREDQRWAREHEEDSEEWNEYVKIIESSGFSDPCVKEFHEHFWQGEFPTCGFIHELAVFGEAKKVGIPELKQELRKSLTHFRRLANTIDRVATDHPDDRYREWVSAFVDKNQTMVELTEEIAASLDRENERVYSLFAEATATTPLQEFVDIIAEFVDACASAVKDIRRDEEERERRERRERIKYETQRTVASLSPKAAGAADATSKEVESVAKTVSSRREPAARKEKGGAPAFAAVEGQGLLDNLMDSLMDGHAFEPIRRRNRR
eukprot:gnl/Chilomastix_cuspidata/2835.p1 GENE.gnl/Chilomastix_cuspidata/2835~~gnl/Chilomastix_cuspidata/2835.p1  ORF type:complete len:1207 (+),score=410.26 gnl/Chilomastix_cuspidata/2835:43-3663(+)